MNSCPHQLSNFSSRELGVILRKSSKLQMQMELQPTNTCSRATREARLGGYSPWGHKETDKVSDSAQHMQPNVSAETHALMLPNEAALLPRPISRWRGCAQSCLTLCHSFDCSPPGSSAYRVSQASMGCHFLLQGIFATQGLNPCLLHCG